MAAKKAAAPGLRSGPAKGERRKRRSSSAAGSLKAAKSNGKETAAKQEVCEASTFGEARHLLQSLRTRRGKRGRRYGQLRGVRRRLGASGYSRVRLLDSALPGCIALDAEGRIRQCNFAAATFLGRRRRQLLGRPLARCVARSDRAAFLDHLLGCVPAHPVDVCELSLRGEDGREIAAELHTVLVGDCKRGIIRYRTTIGEVPDRRRVAEALRESEQKYRSLVENSADGIAIVRGREVKFVNRALVEMLGCRGEAEIVGRPFTDFASLEERDMMAEYGRARERGCCAPACYQFKALRKDGTTFDAELAVSRITFEGASARQGIVRDVTARKRAETLLRAKRDLAVALGAAASLREGLRLALDLTIGISGMDCGGVYLADEKSGALRLACHKGLSPGFVRSVSLYEKDSANTRLVMAGRPAYSEHRRSGVPLSPGERSEGLGAIAVLPLLHRGQGIGCLNVASHSLHEVPPWSRELLEAIAAQIAGTVSRLKAEEALREREETLKAILAASPVGIGLSRGRNIIWANQAMARITGYPEHSLRGSTRLLYPDDEEYERIGRELDAQMRAKGTAEVDAKVLAKDGRVVDCHMNLGYLTRSDPSRGIIGVVVDVTAWKQAERLLRESEERFRVLFEQAADPVVLVDVQTHALVDFNHVAHQSLGYSREEFAAMRVEDLQAAESGEEVGAHAARICAKGSDTFDTKLRAKNGEIRDILMKVRSVALQGKGYLLCVCHDITERIRAEEALRAERDRAQRYLAIAGVMMVAIDAEEKVALINQRGCEVLGYREEEIVGANWFDCFIPERIRGEIREVFRGLMEGRVRPLEWVENFVVTKDGSQRIILWHNTVLTDEVGKITGMLRSGEDITEREAAAEELRRLEAQLAHVGRLSVMGEMVAGIAHEVNQPLYSILNFAKASGNLLAGAGEPNVGDLRQWNEEIMRAAARAGQILSRLRSFARRVEPRRSLVDVGEVVGQAVELAAFENRGREVAVEIDSSPEVLFVRAHRVQIQQVLLNLLRNAHEAAEQGGAAAPQVRIRTCRSGESVEVSVADNGPGLLPEEDSRIFEPFVTTKADGLGMGLAISKTIVEAHGGRLWASSTEGGGATFRFALPAVEGGKGNVG